MPKIFTSLPLLDFVVDELSKPVDYSEVAVISVQHLLETTGSLFESLIKIGIPCDQICVTGKLYSNDQRTARKLKKIGLSILSSSDGSELGMYYDLLENDCKMLWSNFLSSIRNKKIKTIVVLDDGGMLLKTLPDRAKEIYDMVGIEQTSSGVKLNPNPKIPIINVARSLVKTYMEPAFISQAVIQKTRMRLLELRPKSIGIVGFGTIGKGLFHDLKNSFEILLYDKSTSLSVQDQFYYDKHSSTLAELYSKSDVIIGATGTDISFVPVLDNMEKDKILMSVSSGDIEFKSMLKEIQNREQIKVNSILNEINHYSVTGFKLTILRGGTPVNFDNNIHSVLPEYIQLTRGLLLMAAIQAVECAQELSFKKAFVDLDYHNQIAILQRFISLPDVNLENFDFQPPLLEFLS